MYKLHIHFPGHLAIPPYNNVQVQPPAHAILSLLYHQPADIDFWPPNYTNYHVLTHPSFFRRRYQIIRKYQSLG